MNTVETAVEGKVITWGVKSFFKRTPDNVKKIIVAIGIVFASLVTAVQLEPTLIPEPYRKDIAGAVIVIVFALQAIGVDTTCITDAEKKTPYQKPTP